MHNVKDMKNSKKIVVVGGAGFIGSHLVHSLVERGDEVHVIDNLSAGKKENVDKGATLHVLDMRNREDIEPVIKGADTVFLLAALPSIQYSIRHPEETHDVNVNGIFNVLLAAKEGGVRRLVYSASSSAYGRQKVMPVVETMLPDPISPYGLQKHIGERYCRVFNEAYGLETVSLRYFNVYGLNQNPEGEYAAVISKFVDNKKKGKKLPITGDGEQTRDFTHVSDVVIANLLAAEKNTVGKGEVINIGAGNNCTINNLAKIIGGEVEYLPARPEVKHSQADNAKAKELLGWEPTVTLEEGIAKLLKE